MLLLLLLLLLLVVLLVLFLDDASPSLVVDQVVGEHLVAARIDGPIASLAVDSCLLRGGGVGGGLLARLAGGGSVRIGVIARKLDEALVEAEIVAYAVLPALLVALVVGKLAANELVDLRESEATRRRALDRHADQRHVRVRRLLQVRWCR